LGGYKNPIKMHVHTDKEMKMNLKIFCTPLLQKFQNGFAAQLTVIYTMKATFLTKAQG
jgi:hypothetical protein